MKKKSLILALSLFLYFTASCAQADDAPPPLPSEENVPVSSHVEDSKSFWSKLVDFFSFSKDKKKETSESHDQTSNSEVPLASENLENSSGDVMPPVKEEVEQEKADLPLNVPQISEIINEKSPAIEEKVEPSSPKEKPKALPDKSNLDDVNRNNKEDKGSSPENDINLSFLPSNNISDKGSINEEKKELDSVASNALVTPKEKALSDDPSLVNSGEPSSDLKPLENVPPILDPKEIVNTSNNIQNQENALPSSDNKISEVSKKLNDKEAVKEIEDSDSAKVGVAKYLNNLKDRLSNSSSLPQISEKDINTTSTGQDSGIDPKQLKFVNDESQVLLLPDDEVVLGKVTEEARLDLMDFSSYVKIFWDNYNTLKNEPARQAIDNFIKKYDSERLPLNKEDVQNAFAEALNAIDRGNVYDLKKLIDNYPILQKVDDKGNNLLHIAVYKGEYYTAKLLIMRGINTCLINKQNLRALDIAADQNDPDIITLLKSVLIKS